MIPNVRIRVGQSVSPLSDLWRPNVMVTHADGEAMARLLALPKLGFVRVSMEPCFSDVEQFESRVRAMGAQLRQLADRGADLVVMFGLMPKWLSSRMNESANTEGGVPIWAAAPPFRPGEVREIARRVATIFRVEFNLTHRWEIWNEPDGGNFWLGSEAELFSLYAEIAAGLREADPEAPVGGMAFSNFWSGLMQRFITWAGGSHVPLDFASWHCFTGKVEHGANGPAQIRSWLAAAGLPESTPQLVTEWAPWTVPGMLDPFRDTTECVAYTLESLHRFDALGVHGVLRAALQDFGTAEAGGFGLLTKAPCKAKPAWSLYEALSQLGTNRLSLEIRDNPHGVKAVAAQDGAGRVRMIVHRYDPGGVDQVRVFPSGHLSGVSRLLGRVAHFFA